MWSNWGFLFFNTMALEVKALTPYSTRKLGKANKPCHPNPIALVGNLLTGRGKVVEVVKAR